MRKWLRRSFQWLRACDLMREKNSHDRVAWAVKIATAHIGGRPTHKIRARRNVELVRRVAPAHADSSPARKRDRSDALSALKSLQAYLPLDLLPKRLGSRSSKE